jgi:hypothetical protein
VGFELLDLPAHGRLRQVQLAGRQREAQAPRGGIETAQQFERRQLGAGGFRILWMHATSSE